MSEGPVKPPRTWMDRTRAFYGIFGWRWPAVTMFGLLFLIAVAAIPFRARRSVSWLEETALATFAGLLTIVGVSSLRERWLSLGPLEGFLVRWPGPRRLLRWLACAALAVLGSILLIGWFVQPPVDKRLFWITPMLGACCLLGALAMVGMTLMAPRHILVREGLVLRHRGGWTLIPPGSAWGALLSALSTRTSLPQCFCPICSPLCPLFGERR